MNSPSSPILSSDSPYTSSTSDDPRHPHSLEDFSSTTQSHSETSEISSNESHSENETSDSGAQSFHTSHDQGRYSPTRDNF